MLVLPAYSVLLRPSQRTGTWLSRRNRPSAASALARAFGGLLGVLLLALGGDAARVELGDRVDLDLGVGTQAARPGSCRCRCGWTGGGRRRRCSLPRRGSGRARVRRRPSRSSRRRPGRAPALWPARQPPGLLDDLLAERNRELAADSIPRERDASVPETHVRSSQRLRSPPQRRVDDPPPVQSRSSIRSGGPRAALSSTRWRPRAA